MQLLCNTGAKCVTRVQSCVTPVQITNGLKKLKNNRNPTRANQMRAIDVIRFGDSKKIFWFKESLAELTKITSI